ncbi:5568_t:CDS:2 [Acaulospora colombiana]|uniref:5568_t:CDS:1 n=1 Tax=Acaulospora colombiana TaxID=27376 RepID=A0ACA9MBQ2_9GLOM|nr:5568_t:CDS:2 [Acaulospora colombiana]
MQKRTADEGGVKGVQQSEPQVARLSLSFDVRDDKLNWLAKQKESTGVFRNASGNELQSFKFDIVFHVVALEATFHAFSDSGVSFVAVFKNAADIYCSFHRARAGRLR